MKIVFAGHDSTRDISGVSSWLVRLLPCLRDAGMQVEAHLFQIDPGEGATARLLRQSGIDCRTAPWPADTGEGAARSLDWLLESRPDVYVPNCMVPAYVAAATARSSGALTVGVLHSDDPFYHGIIDGFVAGPARWRLGALVVVSDFLEKTARLRAAEMPIARIPCGVPLNDAPVAPPPRPFRLIWTGRMIDEQKRATDTARALASALEKWPDCAVSMIGDGPALPAIREIFASYHAAGRVDLPGRLDQAEIQSRLSSSHAFVLLSDYEGLSVSLLEGMAAGLPPVCLATRSGLADLLVNETNGLIVRDRGPDFLAAIARLRDDPTLRERIGKAARATVAKDYSIETCAKRWMDFVAQNRPPSAPRPDYRRPARLRLPPYNPKLGYFDRRPPGMLRRLRSYLGRLLPRP